MTELTPLPIACTLTPDAARERIGWLEHMGRSALIDGERDGDRLRLRFRTESRRDVETFVSAESECCRFLSFDLGEADGELTLDITGPAGSESVLDGFLAALSGQDS
jgi:hypothetical protein